MMMPRERVSFCTAMKNGCMNYVNFEGRIRRSEYWWFMLIINSVTAILLVFLILSICGVFSTYYYREYRDSYGNRYSQSYYRDNSLLPTLIIFLVYICGIMLPTLAATVRRLHDIGRQGETIFMGLVPLAGGITLLVLLCSDSMKESNEYGPSTKYASADFKEDINEKDISHSIN